MRILFIQLLLPIVCYFIGVAVGRRTKSANVSQNAIGDDVVQISHVGYTSEQMGYDK